MAKAKAKLKVKAKAKPRARVKAKVKKRVRPKPKAAALAGPHLHTLRSCIYQVDDLVRAKEFYREALGKEPYFDEPYYVGFDVDGTELGLDPDVSKRPPGAGGTVAYWRVADINLAWQHLTAIGAQSIELPHAVGVDLQTSIVADPFGNYIGLIQGP